MSNDDSGAVAPKSNTRSGAENVDSRTRVITQQLRAELLHEGQASTPNGRELTGEARAYDLGWIDGHNACALRIIGRLEQGDVEAGLRELAASPPQLPRHWLAVHEATGEGG